MTANAIRPRLADGGTIAIVAPSSHIPTDSLSFATTHLAGLGYRTEIRTTPDERDRFMSAPDGRRAADIMDAFLDPTVDAIFAARGGYGSSRILDQLDYTRIAANPKPFVSFSDGTALQLALLSRANLVTFTGATASVFHDFRAHDGLLSVTDTLWPLLRGDGITVPCTDVLREGAVTGRLIGGCLSLVASLVGTHYLPDMRGAILLIEDVNEQPFRIDRMLTQLRHAGVFADVAGIVFGQFRGCRSRDTADGTVEDVIAEVASWTDGPVVAGVPYGHVMPRRVLPLGERVSLDTCNPDGALVVPAVTRMDPKPLASKRPY